MYALLASSTEEFCKIMNKYYTFSDGKSRDMSAKFGTDWGLPEIFPKDGFIGPPKSLQVSRQYC